MDRGINPDSWDGILSTRGSKLTLIAYVLSARHEAWSFQNDYFHWGEKGVFAKSQECSFQKVHTFLKQRLTNETPKVLLKSCLHLRWLGSPGTLLVRCVVLGGEETLGEEDWVRLRISEWVGDTVTARWWFCGGALGSVFPSHPSRSPCFSQTYFWSSFKNLVCHTRLIIRSLFIFPDSIWLLSIFFFLVENYLIRGSPWFPGPRQPAWGIKLKK